MKSSAQKPNLVPKLRFPEFRQNPGWQVKEVGKAYIVTRGEVLSMKLVQETKSAKAPYPVYSSQTKQEGLCGYYSKYLYADAITWTTDGANAGDVNFRPGKFYCTNVCGVLISTDGHANSCMAAILNSLARRYVSYVGNPKLMNGVMSRIEIPIPDKAEQQKIAECLSSLDELINAENQTLEALKSHKKGLMQQLFPREGETLPRLRFPEFSKGSTWKSKEICEMLQESPRPIKMSYQNEYSLVTVKRRYGGVVSRGVLTGREILVKSQFLVKQHDFLISKRQIVHNACGVVPSDLDGSIVSNEYSVLTAREGCDIQFFNYFAQQPCVSESFLQCSVGIVIEKMLFKLDRWLKSKFLFPSFGEQKKIASCLSSLDALIAAQLGKLEVFQTHKKGLMQQLFPKP